MKTFRHVDRPEGLVELNVITEETGRRYQTPAGLWYPSITTVLSLSTRDGINAWRDKVGHEYADSKKRRAGLRGTRYHAFAERYLNNEQPDINELNLIERDVFRRSIPALDRIDDIMIQEAPLYSDYLKIAGRMDCRAKFDGRWSIIDFKTSEHEKDIDHVQHYLMQTAGYAIMFEERTGIPTKQLVLIIASDIGPPQIIISERDRHVQDLLYWRTQYELEYGI